MGFLPRTYLAISFASRMRITSNLQMDKRNVANKAHLVESIVRHRVQDSLFYKQYLHLTNEKTILPIIVEHVHYIGGTDAGSRPSPFLCCLVRLLELEPSRDIIDLYLRQNGYNEFKYLTALALLYCRMVYGGGFYDLHDEYILDYRKLRFKLKLPEFDNGIPVHYKSRHFDEWVDDLVESDRVVDIKTPYLAPRSVYIERGEAEARVYAIDEEAEAASDDSYQSDSD